MVPLHPALFPPSLTLSLSRSTRRALLRHARGTLGPLAPDAAFPLAEALFTRPVPAPFAALLSEVTRFSSPAAQEAAIEAAIDLAPKHPCIAAADAARTWPQLPPADLAFLLAHRASRRSPSSPAWRALASRIHARLGRHFAPLASYDERLLVPARPSSPTLVDTAARLVHGDTSLRVFVADTEDGVLHFAILHRAPATVAFRWDDDGVPHARRSAAPACDVLRWDAVRGRVSFRLARPALLADWRSALAAAAGVVLLSDGTAFTLKPLHERGSALLAKARGVGRMLDVEVVACDLDDGTRFTVREPSALDALQERIGHGGYLYRATLRFRIDGAPRPVDATIELPNKLLLSEARWEDDVRAALDALGLTEPGAHADDLASLAPFVHPEWRWVELAGRAAFDHAMARGLLVADRSRRAGDPRHRRFGSMFTVHTLDDGASYAVADDAAARAHTVPASALARWRLDLDALSRALREDLALEPLAIREAPRGVLPIGALRAKGGSAALFLLLAAAPEPACKALREAVRKACAKGETPVVLVGPGRTLHGGIAEIEVTPEEQLAGGAIARVVAAAAEAAGLADDLPAWRWGTPEAPLVVHREAREAWLGRVKLAITATQYEAIERLALARGAWVSAPDLGRALSPKSAWFDQIARKALADLDARVARSFEEAGIALPEAWRGKLVERSKAKGYRIGIGVVVR